MVYGRSYFSQLFSKNDSGCFSLNEGSLKFKILLLSLASWKQSRRTTLDRGGLLSVWFIILHLEQIAQGFDY